MANIASDATPGGAPQLLDRMRDRIRLKHYSVRTERAYVHWVKRYILFHDKRHPVDMGKAEVEAFLTHLAVHGQVAASAQKLEVLSLANHLASKRRDLTLSS